MAVENRSEPCVHFDASDAARGSRFYTRTRYALMTLVQQLKERTFSYSPGPYLGVPLSNASSSSEHFARMNQLLSF